MFRYLTIGGKLFDLACCPYEELHNHINKSFSEAVREKDARIRELEGALIRLRDCDWTISLPDRMDAVRNIARKALKGATQ
jgi:hypothetical protein